MSRILQPTPNTHLGEVHWNADMFFGTLLPVCQGLLGMNGTQSRRTFLDAEHLAVDELYEFFEEVELSNGMLGLDLFADQDWHGCVLARIETKLQFNEDLDDEIFVNLVKDFIEHVRSLPLGDLSKREGALWTDEDIERGYCEAANQMLIEGFQELNDRYHEAMLETSKKIE